MAPPSSAIRQCRVRWLFLGLGAGMACAPASAAGTTGQDAPVPDAVVLEAFLDGLLRAQLHERRIAGATVAAVGGGRVLFTRGYGYADLDGRRRVDPEETLFRIASVTKLFTYAAVMQLVERGQVDLHTDVNEYLDFRIPDTFDEPITPFHLLTHTAGFEEDLRNVFSYDPARIMPLADFVRDHQPHRVRPLGAFSSYSNYGAALAGYIVQRVSGVPWEDWVQEQLLRPLGMKSTTTMEPLPEALAPRLSHGYAHRRGRHVAQPLEISPGGAPAGSMSSTAADMATFMLAVLGGGAVDGVRVLEETTVRDMLARHFTHDPRLPGYGLGFFEMTSHGVRILGHGGNTGWFHNLLLLFPDHDLGIFVSFNTTTAAPLTYGPLVSMLLDRFFPDPPRPATATDPETLARLAGSYRFNRISYTTFQKMMGLAMTLEVSQDDGALAVRSPLGTMRMVEVEPLLFGEELGSTLLAFRTDDTGRGTHAFLSNAPMMAAERVPWYGSPGLHFSILGGGLLLFVGILFAGMVGWLRRRMGHLTERDGPATTRRALVVAAGANLGFVLLLAVLLAPDPFEYLSTPMTGLMLALALPVLGAGAAGVAVVTVGVRWKRGDGPTWRLVGAGAAGTAALLFSWSLYYWNLLGWRL